MVYTIGTVEFDGVEESTHYVRPEVEVFTRAGSSRAIVQERRRTSPVFVLRAWKFLGVDIAPDTHLYATLGLIGKKSAVVTDTTLMLAENPFTVDQKLIVRDVEYRVRNRRGRAFIEYNLSCVTTGTDDD